MKTLLYKILATLCGLAVCGGASLPASAFATDTYAAHSVLADGRWVRVSVESSGVYALTASQLRSMGFSDPRRVRIFGYGARQIENRLSKENYVDDLPMVNSMVSDAGSVIFYAQGPDWWTTTSLRYNKKLNMYATRGYYFVTELSAQADTLGLPAPVLIGSPAAAGDITTVTGRLHHELNIATPGESGAELVGEDFRLTPTRRFSFTLTDRDESAGADVSVECSFVTRTLSRSSTLAISDGATEQTLAIGPTVNDGSYYGVEGLGRYSFAGAGTKLDLTLSYSSPVTIHGAWLNYLTVNYHRRLVIPAEGWLGFGYNRTQATIGGISGKVCVWDVTNPRQVLAMTLGDITDGRASWINAYTGNREYVAFNPDARLPQPTVEGTVANQDLHAIEQADMVIVTLPAWRSQAERVAQLHTDADSLTCRVVNAADIYNEFGSGAADPGALRRFFKMLYDRGRAQGRPLRYALIMARYSYDNLGGTQAFLDTGIPTIPSWYPSGIATALSDKIGYGSDDILAMLADGAGYDISTDKLSIAVGRIPCRSLQEATQDIDKLEDYMHKSRNTAWRNKIFVLADDGDNGTHMNQASQMCENISPEDNPRYVINKVYIDAYQREGSSYPQAREAMFRYLDEGAMFWIYLGHANNHQWTHDGQLTFTDINNLYLKHVPALFAGTCEFARWDSNTESGAEIMFHERYGGCIAMITATRPVYISDNGLFSQAIGRALGSRDSDGLIWRMGDIYRLAKNDIRNEQGRPTSDTNRLRYVLIGDPALKLVMPDNLVKLEAVDGIATDGEEQIVIPALGSPRLTGTVTDPQGNIIGDFDGTIEVTLYDAAKSTTSHGWGEDGAEVTFDEHGSKLYTGIINVTAGRFDQRINMPAEIADNFRPALAAFYAHDSARGRHAAGVSSRFYVYGLDEAALGTDTVPPCIDAIYLNHESFANGGSVNASPTLIARLSDDVGINISSAGIGHQMTLQIDGNKSYNNLSEYFTPASDGSPAGQIVYQLPTLTEGNHTLSFRVWDTSGNSARADVDFFVDPKSAPKVYDIYADCNPASTYTNFYITTDRPDNIVTVSVTVYNLLGHPLWSKSVTGLNDMMTTSPVHWDLCDAAGRRVPRGIYLYRATITDNGETFDTGSRRIAVTGQ